MGDEKPAIVMANLERDRELMIPVADSGEIHDGPTSKPYSSSSSSSSSHQSNHEGLGVKEVHDRLCYSTSYITWWFIHFVDGLFSSIYAQLGINVFGFGFLTSIAFIFLVEVFMSSWLMLISLQV